MNHDEFEKLIDGKITKEEVKLLGKYGWFVDEDWVSHFV